MDWQSTTTTIRGAHLMARYHFGDVVRRRREQLGYSQERLAELMEDHQVHQTTVSRWERSPYAPKDEPTREKLAQVLRIDVDTLLGLVDGHVEEIESDIPSETLAEIWARRLAAPGKDPSKLASIFEGALSLPFDELLGLGDAIQQVTDAWRRINRPDLGEEVEQNQKM